MKNLARRAIEVCALTAIGTVMVCASPGAAHADETSFVKDLIRMGLMDSVASQDVQQAGINLGWAICHAYDKGLNDAQVMKPLLEDNSRDDAAMWIAIATQDLCPQYS
ncbi:DUF732 domain-containing protein [Nocardia sp. NPDC059240]|uniref:DUF732 domain-containing protein n=1 Tax=Nocardia sp. NPDC059240 TaxID=3346786 RepID=UPI00369B042E